MKGKIWLIVYLVLLLALLAGSLTGGYYSWTFYQKNLALEVQNQELQNLVSTTSNNLASTTLRLEEESNRTNILANQINNIASTVGELNKLRQIDKELLIKYSKISFLNEHYVPASLATITPAFISNHESQRILTGAWPFLERLLVTASSSGIDMRVNSAYRSFGTQAKIKTGYNFTYGAGTANTFSADQGYSEHQLGTTVDFSAPNTGGDFKFGETKAFSWLVDNAYRYGFILSYPKNNDYYRYEPWHWRFVGVKLATKMHEENKYFFDYPQRTLDQYLVSIFD